MNQKLKLNHQLKRSGVKLVEVSVVLVTNQNDPSILNPDFLRHNKFVDAGLQVRDAPLLSPVFSQVRFHGGITVKADPERIILEQANNDLALENVKPPTMAKQFVKLFPNSVYKAVGINSKFFCDNANQPMMVSDFLVKKGEWLSFQSSKPTIQLKSVHRLEDKAINLDVVEAKGNNSNNSEEVATGILFQANIHRDLQDADQDMRKKKLLSVISSWKKDLSDIRDLLSKFDLRRIE